MIEYSSLENTSLVDLHMVFLKAFSDYQVQINLPFPKFENMLRRRGYSADLSVGAFNGDELVGSILNGYRLWNNIETLYDIGTGVVPDFRQQGITTNMLRIIQGQLEKSEIKQYLLEVIKTNTSAVALYKKQGFTTSRLFSCYRLEQPSCDTRNNRFQFEVVNLQSMDWKTFKSFWDIQPSWQNSIDSLLSVPASYSLVTAVQEGVIIGYGVIDIETGDIAQLAVHQHYRRQGVGTELIAKMIENAKSPKASITNVDDSYFNFKAFLIKMGFQIYLQQYEMVLTI